MRKILRGRKLLVASLGVAAVSYACQGKPEMTGNLMPAPPPDRDAGSATLPQLPPPEALEVSGNLMPPTPPPDIADAGTKSKKVKP